MSAPPKPFAKAKRAVLKALRDRGIVDVEIVYDGEGDSGQIGVSRPVTPRTSRCSVATLGRKHRPRRMAAPLLLWQTAQWQRATMTGLPSIG